MATVEVEKLIRKLEPQQLQELINFIDYLLFVQEKHTGKNGRSKTKTKGKNQEVNETTTSERLKVAQRYFDSAPKPHFPVTKYDVYEQ